MSQSSTQTASFPQTDLLSSLETIPIECENAVDALYRLQIATQYALHRPTSPIVAMRATLHSLWTDAAEVIQLGHAYSLDVISLSAADDIEDDPDSVAYVERMADKAKQQHHRWKQLECKCDEVISASAEHGAQLQQMFSSTPTKSAVRADSIPDDDGFAHMVAAHNRPDGTQALADTYKAISSIHKIFGDLQRFWFEQVECCEAQPLEVKWERERWMEYRTELLRANISLRKCAEVILVEPTVPSRSSSFAKEESRDKDELLKISGAAEGAHSVSTSADSVPKCFGGLFGSFRRRSRS